MNDTGRPEAASESPPRAARRLIRQSLKAALATLDRASGYPYASLITVATEPSGAPVFLISKLAKHTQNLEADRRAAILFDGTSGVGDPLQGGRVSVYGLAERSDRDRARSRFLARHPEAEFYAGFADFAFWRLHVEGAHFVGGFGRIHDLEPADLLIETGDATALIEAETDVVEHMNVDHRDAVALYATRLLGGEEGPWRLSGCDPEGCDLILGDKTLRLDFPERVTGPQAIRKALIELVQKARGEPPRKLGG